MYSSVSRRNYTIWYEAVDQDSKTFILLLIVRDCVSNFSINQRNENNTADDTSTYFKTCRRSIIFEAEFGGFIEVINDNMAILTGWEESVDVEQN